MIKGTRTLTDDPDILAHELKREITKRFGDAGLDVPAAPEVIAFMGEWFDQFNWPEDSNGAAVARQYRRGYAGVIADTILQAAL